jgi:rod shape determining protein RodA
MRHVWVITFCLVILTILSLFNTLSQSVQSDGSLQISDLFFKHMIFMIVGWVTYISLSRANYSLIKYRQFNILLYILTIGLLLATILWGPVINNTQRWLIFGEFQFQPSELAKLAIIFFTGYLFTLRDKVSEPLLLFISFFLLVPILSIIYLQPHGSMSLIILLTWGLLVFSVMKNQLRNFLLLLTLSSAGAGVLTIALGNYTYSIISFIVSFVTVVFAYYARENWRKMFFASLVIGLLLGLLASVTWNSILLDYQKERINAFFNPVETSQDLGFNVDQSRVAIGSGQIWGKGWGFGTQSKLQFLPEYQTDFVFAAFSEEFGLVGSFTLIILYATIIFTTLFYALKSINMNFEFVVLTGIAIKIFLEISINIGTNTGVIPATGIPLPLMSIGGTSILFFFFSLGIVQSIVSNNMETYRDVEYSRVDNDDSLI